MIPLGRAAKTDIENVKFLLTDIDDTLTRDGRVEMDAFSAIWQLSSSGIVVIPVTGRPAGWCDCIIRQWPVEAIIGENGAFAYYRSSSGAIVEMKHPEIRKLRNTVHNSQNVTRDEDVSALQLVWEKVKNEVPGARKARDQQFRLYDLAIDYREDDPKFDLSMARKIKNICESMGAEAKISSIHVNAWFGKYDKLSMVKQYFASFWKMSEESMKKTVIYCGDSPNDEPMFRFFPISCGVANVADFLEDMEAKPGFITEASYGKGFSELADRILTIKSGISEKKTGRALTEN